MPRLPRLLLSQSYYHIMTRGNNRNVVFRKPQDYQYYLDLILRFKKEHPFDLYHYCLMPNHVHMQVKINKASDFSNFMKKLNLAYFHHFRKNYGWIGHFWQDRFKSQPVGKDEYFIQCGKYIELNPIRSHLVKNPQDYQFSSFKYYGLGSKDPLITEDFLSPGLGDSKSERQKAYQDLLIDETVEASYKRKSWGSPAQRYNENKKVKNIFFRRKSKRYE